MRKIIFIIALLLLFIFVQKPPNSTLKAAGNPVYQIIEEKIPTTASIVAFKGVSADEFDPAKLSNWNKYAYDSVIEAEGTALKNVYSTELIQQKDGKWKIFYGGWNTDDPQFTADRIHSAVSTNFLFKDKYDFSPPTWTDRKVVISNNEGVIANDPTIVEYAPNQYIMHFSKSAPPVNGVKVSDTISYSVSNNLTDWLYTKPDTNNPVTITAADGTIVEFLHRPSLVFDNGTFYLYYDQGGNPKATKNNGFTIRVAKGVAGQFLSDVGEVFLPSSPENGYAGTPEVEKFSKGWIMFYDRHLNALAYALSTNGLQFEDKGKLTEDPTTTITNVNVIRKDDRLLGILFGAFPKLNTVASCQYPTGDYCLSNGKVNAYFLQKKVVFTTTAGEVWNLDAALDEDRLELKTNLPPNGSAEGTIRLYDTDGTTLLFEKQMNMKVGYLYTFIKANASVTGDANNDSKVDGLDYIIWLTHFGQTVTNAETSGDFNKDEKVDGLDYVIWLNNFN